VNISQPKLRSDRFDDDNNNNNNNIPARYEIEELQKAAILDISQIAYFGKY